MKLSDLVNFRNELNALSVKEIEQDATARLNIITHLIQSNENETNVPSTELHPKLSEIQRSFNNFDIVLNQLRKQVNEQIAEAEKVWFRESYKEFEVARVSETTHHILNNRRPMKTATVLEAEETLRSRLANFGNWKYPGMIIRPGLEDFIENMVGYDPLYIVDRNYELLQPALDRFPKLYQNRLRQYTVDDWSDEPLMSKIPNNQFGMCLAYNVFNFRPLEIIRRYLEEIYEKLRPGGVLIMTYNDCDRTHAVRLVENFFASYTPGYLIRDLAESIGFKQTYTWDDGGPSVWLELCKPGELTSLRGGQSIAKMHPIGSYFEDVDFLQRKTYTDEEIKELYSQAAKLNLDKIFVSQAKPFELQMMINEKNREKEEELRLEYQKEQVQRLHDKAKRYNIDIYRPDLEYHVHEAEQEELARVKYGIDTNLIHWKNILEKKKRQEAKEAKRKLEEELRLAKEAEEKRIAELHQRARDCGLDPTQYKDEVELHNQIAETVDKMKKEELKQLRQRATELGVGDPNLVRYGYSAEKLKQLIKAKEEE